MEYQAQDKSVCYKGKQTSDFVPVSGLQLVNLGAPELLWVLLERLQEGVALSALSQQQEGGDQISD